MSNTVPLILVAYDDCFIRTVLNYALIHEGYQVQLASTAKEIWPFIKENKTDLVIANSDSVDFANRIESSIPALQFMKVDVLSTESTALYTIHETAKNSSLVSFDLKQLLIYIRQKLHRDKSDCSDIEQCKDTKIFFPIGQSISIQRIQRDIISLTNSDLAVLITGESGTEKEGVAQALHTYSLRKDNPFVTIDMNSLSYSMIQRELFGNPGKSPAKTILQNEQHCLKRVASGTLFLNEIGEMPLEIQTQFLQLLKDAEKQIYEKGEGIYNVRIIASTKQNLKELILLGKFNADLYKHLNAVSIYLPPLRERKEDIGLLIEYYLKKFKKTERILSPEMLNSLKNYKWPGNVYELKNLITYLANLNSQQPVIDGPLRRAKTILSSNKTLSDFFEEQIDQYFSNNKTLSFSNLYADIMKEIERLLLRRTLRETNGNQMKAATILGLNRNTLRKKIRELAILPHICKKDEKSDRV